MSMKESWQSLQSGCVALAPHERLQTDNLEYNLLVHQNGVKECL